MTTAVNNGENAVLQLGDYGNVSDLPSPVGTTFHTATLHLGAINPLVSTSRTASNEIFTNVTDGEFVRPAPTPSTTGAKSGPVRK